MAIVKAYTPRLRDITPMSKSGGYDASNKTFTPFAEISDDLSAVEEVLDAITAAAEAGFCFIGEHVRQCNRVVDIGRGLKVFPPLVAMFVCREGNCCYQFIHCIPLRLVHQPGFPKT